MEEKLTIGEQLKQARVKSGMTQVELWEKSRISLFTISGLETGRIKNISTHTLRAFQFVLNIKFDI